MIASLVGWLTVLLFAIGLLEGHSGFAGTAAGVGILVYLGLRVLRGIIDPVIVWLLTRGAA
jgi:hypothetical protein